MREIRFEQSRLSVPNVERTEDGSYELWFTAFDKEGMEKDVFITLPAKVYPKFRQYVNEAPDQSLTAVLVADDPLSGIDSLAEAYARDGDVVGVWHVLVEALGRANVHELMNKQLGWEKAHAIHRKIKGED